MIDDLLRARLAARRDELSRSAAGAGVRNSTAARAGSLARMHLRLWWATRPRRDMRCLVTSADGLSVLGGGQGR